jgi:hypothetical protein
MNGIWGRDVSSVTGETLSLTLIVFDRESHVWGKSETSPSCSAQKGRLLICDSVVSNLNQGQMVSIETWWVIRYETDGPIGDLQHGTRGKATEGNNSAEASASTACLNIKKLTQVPTTSIYASCTIRKLAVIYLFNCNTRITWGTW